MPKNIVYLFLICQFIASCKTQSDEQTIQQTSEDVVTALSKADAKKFLNLIAHQNLRTIGKNEEMVTDDVNRFNELFDASAVNGRPKPQIRDLYNGLGQRVVKIGFEGPRTEDDGKLELWLLFGPPNLFSLEQITDYQLVTPRTDTSEFHPSAFWASRKR